MSFKFSSFGSQTKYPSSGNFAANSPNAFLIFSKLVLLTYLTSKFWIIKTRWMLPTEYLYRSKPLKILNNELDMICFLPSQKFGQSGLFSVGGAFLDNSSF